MAISASQKSDASPIALFCELEIDLLVDTRKRKLASHRGEFDRAAGIRTFAVKPIPIILPDEPFDAAFRLRHKNVFLQ